MDSLMANQMILYENDAVLVSYTNGAGLQLAPCSSAFTYYHPLKDGEHPIHGQRKVLQRTQFVTSTFKSIVIEAIDFRNRFAQYPYLCKDIIEQKQISKLHADICEIAWPEKLDKASIQILEDHSIMVTSLCNCAKLSLSSSRQLFTVQFLCRVSQQQEKEKWTPMKKGIYKDEEETKNGDRVDRMWKYCVKSKDSNLVLSKENQKSSPINTEGSSIFKEGQWDYTWVVQHFSVHECPKVWTHPLNLAHEAMQKQRYVTFEPDSENGTNNKTVDESNLYQQTLNLNDYQTSDEESNLISGIKNDNNITNITELSIPVLSEKTDVKRLTNCVFSSVTKSLPLNCVSSHLHKWGSKDFWDAEEKQAESSLVNGRIKVICARGVIYRFLWEQPKAIEIYPGDGTVLRSSGLAGQFFTHFIYNNGKVDEKMYAVNMPPPDIPGSKYSIARLLQRGERYLRHLYEDSLSRGATNHNYCWKIQPASRKVHEPLPNTLLEQCVVNGVGKFTAYSSGRVRVVFTDRTALDMYANFSKRLGHCKQHSDQETHYMPDLHSYQPKSSNVRTLGTDLPQGVCRLMLPNGHYQNVIMAYSEPQFEKYVKAAQEWVSWVNCSPHERNTFYKDTLHDAEKVGEIDRELRKISCFNYIVEKTLLSQFDTKAHKDSLSTNLKDPGVSTNQYLDKSSTNFTRSFINDTFHSNKSSNTDATHTNKLVGALKQLSDNISSNDLLCNTAYIPPDDRPSTTDSTSYRSFNTTSDAQSRSQYSTERYDSFDVGQESAYNLAMVEQILNKTSQAVNDLDKYLKSNGEEQPVQDQ